MSPMKDLSVFVRGWQTEKVGRLVTVVVAGVELKTKTTCKPFEVGPDLWMIEVAGVEGQVALEQVRRV